MHSREGVEEDLSVSERVFLGNQLAKVEGVDSLIRPGGGVFAGCFPRHELGARPGGSSVENLSRHIRLSKGKGGGKKRRRRN